MQITAPIYGYIGGAYYTGYAVPTKDGSAIGRVKPAIMPVEKADHSKQSAHRHP